MKKIKSCDICTKKVDETEIALVCTHCIKKLYQWISVKERLPENDIYVLAALKERHPVVSAYLNHSKIWINTNGSEVTHWMLLPEGP